MGGGATGATGQPTSAGGWSPERMEAAGTLPMGRPTTQPTAAQPQPWNTAAPSYSSGGNFRGNQPLPPGHSQAALDQAPDLSRYKLPSMGALTTPNQGSPWGNAQTQPYRVPAQPTHSGGGGRGNQQERTPLSGGPDLTRFKLPEMGRMMNPQGLGGNQNWEDILSRLTQAQGGQSGGRGKGNPWQGGLAALRDRFSSGHQGGGAITNPGSLAASQGAQTASGITAPGSVTGATATPTNANPHAPTSGQQQGGWQGRGNNSHAQQLISALRSRAGR